MSQTRLDKIGFIGLGLIGGSIAKKLKSLHPELEIIATASHIETIQTAFCEGLISNRSFCGMADFADCGYVFLCAPVQKNIEYLRQLKDVISPRCILTDVGSVKSEIHREVSALGLEKNFIGGHPMAGSEKTGLSSASAALLENAYYILTPTAETSPEDLADFTALVESLSAIPLVLDYGLHDYATAAISHLPHIIAFSLVNLIRESDDEGETMKTIAAGGFKDITRIASSSPVIWENICLSNREPILKLLDAYIETLLETRKHIEKKDGQALLESFASARDYRDSISITQKGVLKNVYELYLDLLDEAGGIASVSTVLAEHGLSIKNIGIIHNREFEHGVLRLEMYDEDSRKAAIALLRERRYTIYER